jgi:hypothetical protein
LRAALKEAGVRNNRLLDFKSAQTIGKILGVDSLLIGSVADLVNTIEINVRLISAETGQIMAVAQAEIEKDDMTTKLSAASGTARSVAKFNKNRKRTKVLSRTECEHYFSYQDNLRNGYTP